MSQQINITKFFNNENPRDYSASVAEIGPDAWKITWGAAKEAAVDYNFLYTDELRDDFKDFLRDFGAWSREEMDAWSKVEINALFIQFVAGNMLEAGRCSGQFYKDDAGEIWYDISQ